MESHFNWKYYISSYRDLRKAGINSEKLAWQHWINHGRNEGRHCLIIPKEFDWKYYVNFYYDLGDIKSEIIAYEHYLLHGKKEGRKINNNGVNEPNDAYFNHDGYCKIKLDEYVITILKETEINENQLGKNYQEFLKILYNNEYKFEISSLDKIEKVDKKRIFFTWDEPTSLELYQSGKVNNYDIVFQNLTHEINQSALKTIEYLYDVGLNIHGIGFITNKDLPSTYKVSDKLKNIIHWVTVDNNLENILTNLHSICNNFSNIINEIKSPFIPYEKLSDLDYVIDLKLNYINEILLLQNIINIHSYFYYKLCREFNYVKSYRNLYYNNQIYLEIIQSGKFTEKYHNNKNFCIDTLNEIVKYHRKTNYRIIKKYDIRYSVVKSYLFSNMTNHIKQYTEENPKQHAEDNSKVNTKLFTFIMIIKNRHVRARKCLEYLINNKTQNMANFIIVEDISDDLLDLSDFKYKHVIKHYIVDTKCSWSRAGLLNYGINRCETPHFIGLDCDFYIHENLVQDITKFLLKYKPKNNIGIQCFDTDMCDYGSGFNLPCTPYGFMWLYNTNIVKSVGMFNYEFIGWGLEEREIEIRIHNKHNLKVIKVDNLFPCFHHSHNNKTRSTKNMKEQYLTNRVIYDESVKNKTKEINNYVEYDLIQEKNYESLN